jgi:hypothetical protein
MHVLRLGITGGALLLCLAFGRAPARRPFRFAPGPRQLASGHFTRVKGPEGE